MEKCLGIMSYLARMNVNKEDGTAPFINNLEIIKVFKDEDKKKRGKCYGFYLLSVITT